MKKFPAIALLVIFIAFSQGGCALRQSTVEPSVLPNLFINTKAERGIISNQNYVDTHFIMSNAADGFCFSNMSGRIRLRGNSSLSVPKKSYKIVFDTETSVFGMQPSREWVLLANYYDPSLMRVYSAQRMAKRFTNLGFTFTAEYVNVYLNGRYTGVYLLCDGVDENRLGLTEVTGETAFLVNISLDNERYNLNPNSLFTVHNFGTRENIADIKYPEMPKTNPPPTRTYIQKYVGDVFRAIRTGDGAELDCLCDVDSLVDYLLLNEIMFNSDSQIKSIFVYKSAGGKMKFTPWDFDGAFSIWSRENPYTVGITATHFGDFPVFRGTYGETFLAMGETYYDMVRTRFFELDNAGVFDEYITSAAEIKTQILAEAARNAHKWYKKWGGAELFNRTYTADLLFFENHRAALTAAFALSYQDFTEAAA